MSQRLSFVQQEVQGRDLGSGVHGGLEEGLAAAFCSAWRSGRARVQGSRPAGLGGALPLCVGGLCLAEVPGVQGPAAEPEHKGDEPWQACRGAWAEGAPGAGV